VIKFVSDLRQVGGFLRVLYLSFYWKKWFYIWYMALAWWLVLCLPFPGLPHIYFLFTVRLRIVHVCRKENFRNSYLSFYYGYWCTNSQTFLNHTIPVFCILDSSHLSTRPVVVPMYVSMVIFNKFAIPLVDMSLRTISWYIPVKKIVNLKCVDGMNQECRRRGWCG
jgi:hypothetical protein